MPSVVDDPREVRVQSLSWYVQQATAASAVVCHLLSSDHRGWELHNAKHAPSPVSRMGWANPCSCSPTSPTFPPSTTATFERFTPRRRPRRVLRRVDSADSLHLREARGRACELQGWAAAQGELRNIAVGDLIAEFESGQLPEFFVPTAAYSEALRSKHSIFVGRKGTGKTATLYKLADELSVDTRNFVCGVEPVDYELQGLLDMLAQELPCSEKGYLIESFWKFLLFTESAKSICEQLEGKPPTTSRQRQNPSCARFSRT